MSTTAPLSEPVATPAPQNPGSESWPLSLWLLLGGLAAGWIFYMVQLHLQWGSESYYNYGWFVPFLAALLFYRRWERRPAAAPPPANIALLLVGISLFGALLIMPSRLFSEANPFWRAPLLLQGACLFAITALHIVAVGGRRYLLHFLWPLLFLLTMVPWPFQIEQWIIQGLTEKVTVFTVALFNLLGYNAVNLGSTILINDAQVGVEEACSGIRSLQLLGMAALFIGEFYLLNLWKRFALVIIAFGLVFLFNSLRAAGLSFAVLAGGTEAYEFWHDPLGMISFSASILCLWGITELLNLGNRAEAEPRPQCPQRPAFPSAVLAGAFLAMIVFATVSVEGWFRYHEARAEDLPGWAVKLPEQTQRFVHNEVPEHIEDTLMFDFGYSASLAPTARERATFWYYGYTGEDRMSSVSSYGHHPDICVTAIGGEKQTELDPLLIDLGAFTLPLEHHVYVIPSQDNKEIHVFFSVWEQRNMGLDPEQLQSLDRRAQFQQVLNGRRDYARQVLLLTVENEAIYGEPVPERMRRVAQRVFGNVLEPIPAGIDVPVDGLVADSVRPEF